LTLKVYLLFLQSTLTTRTVYRKLIGAYPVKKAPTNWLSWKCIQDRQYH